MTAATLSIRAIDLHYGAAQALRGVTIEAKPGQDHRRARPQRRRQILDAARHHRHQQRRRPARSSSTTRSCSKRPALQARAHGPRLRAAGARDLPAAHGQGEPRDRLCRDRGQGPQHPRLHLHPIPRAEDHAGPARRRPLGWPAAATGHWPGAGHPTQGPGARRADRGHPALDHQGHRPGAAVPARRHGDDHPPRRAVSWISAARSPTTSTSWTAARSCTPAPPPTSTCPRCAGT